MTPAPATLAAGLALAALLACGCTHRPAPEPSHRMRARFAPIAATAVRAELRAGDTVIVPDVLARQRDCGDAAGVKCLEFTVAGALLHAPFTLCAADARGTVACSPIVVARP